MREIPYFLGQASFGQRTELLTLSFGDSSGLGPKAYIQAGLHAGEVPGMLVAHHLRESLKTIEAEGRIRGEILLVPAANPIGLPQVLLGSHLGRFHLADGVNFNRGYPALTEKAAYWLEGKLTSDPAQNLPMVREALHSALDAASSARPVDVLKKILLRLALDADTVLDLHCDGEAVMHLYTVPNQAEAFAPLSAWLDCKAVLTAELSGDDPFDEAISRPWLELPARFPRFPIPQGAIATTIEFRGEADVDHDLAKRDAEAVLKFLIHRGHIAGDAGPIPTPTCEPTPLAGSESLAAPIAGMIVFRRNLGERIEAGEVVAEIIDPATGQFVEVKATTSGILFARAADRLAQAGKKIGKIAGRTPFRAGKLLSP
ncbi:MAG: succinylglutamate desuccinylase/aspartoacylase family protein [Rhabdaerophilum sp.]